MMKPDTAAVEVDMVPLIDIISLLLMFLVIVGDTSANTTRSNSSARPKSSPTPAPESEQESLRRTINDLSGLVNKLSDKRFLQDFEETTFKENPNPDNLIALTSVISIERATIIPATSDPIGYPRKLIDIDIAKARPVHAGSVRR